MSDVSEDEEVITDIPEPEPPKAKPTKEKKPMSAERLEALARARQKAMEVRKANAEARGKKVVREEKKQIAQKNKDDADAKFRDAVNARVEEEIKKRMDDINLDRMNSLLEEKLKDIKPARKPRKKIVYEDTETESEAEVVKVVRKKKPVIVEPELPKEITPAVNVDTPQMPPQQHQFNQFTNMLRSIPRANRNPHFN